MVALLTSHFMKQSRVLLFPKQALVFMCLLYKSFKNTVGKGEIAHYEQFFFFSHSVFYLFGELSDIFIKFENVVFKLSVWKILKYVV